MYDILYTMIDSVLYAFIAYTFFSMKLNLSLQRLGIIICGYFILVYVSWQWEMKDFLSIFPLHIVYFLFEEKIKNKILILAFICFYTVLIQLICLNILQLSYKEYLSEHNWVNSIFIFFIHISIIVICMKYKIKISFHYEDFIVLLFIISIQLFINTVYSKERQLIMSIIICLIYVFYKYVKYKKNRELQQNDLWKDTFIKKQEENFMELEKRYEDVRRFQHDFHHHIHVIKNISKNQANTYIVYIVKEYETLKVQRCTNMYVDVMIKEYKLKCKQYHIDFHHSYYVDGSIQIESTDLTLLLANLLQNAVEATQKSTVLNKNIKLFMHNVKYHLVIEIENSVEENCDIHYLKEKRTSKFNKDKHGYGLKTIERIIEKYSGDIIYEIKGEKIKIQIMLQGVVEI